MSRRSKFTSTVTAATCAMVLAAAAAPAWASAEPETLRQLEKYCTASWRNARIDMQDWQDCTQQTMVDLLSRVSRDRLTEAIANPASVERRELTRCIWCTVQRIRRARPHFSLEHPVGASDWGESDLPVSSGELRESIENDAAGLSERQQAILLHLLDGYTVGEIADNLCIEPARVSDEKYKAVKKLRRYFLAECA